MVVADNNEALLEYNNAIELDPNYADALVGKGFALLALGWGNRLLNDLPFDKAIALDPNYGLAWIGARVSEVYEDNYRKNEILAEAVKLNPGYATEILSDTSTTLSFQRMVFLKEGCPRTSKATRLIAAQVPQKTVAERFQS